MSKMLAHRTQRCTRHSTNILEVLEDLKGKAEEQLSNLRKAETNTKHNYEMLRQSLEDSIKADNKDMADKKLALQTANSNCMTVAADHESTVAGRNEELKVLKEAKQVLLSTTSGAEGQAYSMLQLAVGSRLRTHADL